MSFYRRVRSLVLTWAWCSFFSALPLFAVQPPNILFIAIDDQNDWLGCLGGHPQVRTPNLDRLAARGTLFTSAHCQAPLCNPSRISLLTGLRPSTTGVHGLEPGLRQVPLLSNHVTLPQTYTRLGWHTYTCGKIYHDGSVRDTEREQEFAAWGPAPSPQPPARPYSKMPQTLPAMDWGPFPEHAEDSADWKIASAAITALRSAPKEKPFFIAAGFRLPHVPCFAPAPWFELYPLDSLKLPETKADDRADTPLFSWFLHWKLPEPRLSALQQHNEWKPLVRAYLASVSFMDSQVGRVLDALEASGRAAQTLVVVWSDHGWHLGEKGITGKNSLWERSTRVPLIWAGPGVTGGARCSRPVELLDVFPTLLELTGQPARPDLEGHSLVPQLREANAPRPWPAITTHNQGNHSIRTEPWRYIRYADGTEELYDEQNDPNEWTNLAADPKTAAIRQDLKRWLPKLDRPMVPGSRSRVLSYDPATKQAVWEGRKIIPEELER
jgi:arylsulfatase A-like enzyme